MAHTPGHYGTEKDLSDPKTFQKGASNNAFSNFFSGWRMFGDGEPVKAPPASTTQAIENAITRVARAANPAQARSTGTFYGNTGPNSRTALGELDALTSVVQSNQEQAIADLVLRNQAKNAASDFARANAFNTDRFRTGATPGLDAAIDLGYVPSPPPSPPSNFGQGGPSMTDLESVAFDNPNPVVIPPDGKLPPGEDADEAERLRLAQLAEAERLRLEAEEAERLRLLGLNQNQTVDAVVPVGDTIRSLYGELSTRDFTAQIAQLMADRAANLRGLNAESAAVLAQTVARRMNQIGSVETDLAADIASREADRLAQQEALAGEVGTRATGLVGDTTASLTAAREALGPQVTDEFERVAQIVESQARSQGTSSQDLMARLGQVANMVAAERQAAPGQLAAEAELALGDEEFAMSNQLQQNLSTQLAGLDAEEAERLLGEQMRQEQFNTGRDADMIQAMVNELIREDTQQFQAGQADLNRGFQTSEREASQLFKTDERLGSETFANKQARLSENFKTNERIAGQQFSRQERLGSEQALFARDAIKAQTDAAAAAIKAGNEAAAAAQMGYPSNVWAGMTDGMKTEILENSIEQNILQGQGMGAAPQGSMANFRGKNPDVDPSYFQHLDGMYGITLLYDTDEEIVDAQNKYLEDLTVDQKSGSLGGDPLSSSYGPKGYGPKEIKEIRSLYERYLIDVTKANEALFLENQRTQNRILNPPRYNPALTAAMNSGTIGR